MKQTIKDTWKELLTGTMSKVEIKLYRNSITKGSVCLTVLSNLTVRGISGISRTIALKNSSAVRQKYAHLIKKKKKISMMPSWK